MSRKLNLANLNMQQREKISKDLSIEVPSSKYSAGPPKIVTPFEVDDNNWIYIPFAYDISIPRPTRKELGTINSTFIGELYEEQENIHSQCIGHLNKTGSSLIAARTGFGKSITAISIAVKIKLKTLIVINRVNLANQWKESIEQFCCSNTKVQILTGKEKKKDVDFYIMNAINISKRTHEEYTDIGFIIIDECHCILADKISKCMTYICPRYILGLSATPYRNDGLNILFDLYFGKNKIELKLYREHTVYIVKTGIKPKTELNANGKINWNALIETLSNDHKRNEQIIQLTKHFPNKVLLIVTKRVEQANYLVNRLQEEGEHVESLIGSKQEFDKKCRILVGTLQKCGTGFDFKQLDGLIMAIDVESYFIQLLGRVFRRRDNIPVIFDLIDDNPILLKHYQTRRQVYIECGGNIQLYKKKLIE